MATIEPNISNPALQKHYEVAYLAFLRSRIEEGLREKLMAVAAKVVDTVVEEALKDLEATIRTDFLPESQRQLVDVIVRRRDG